MRPLSAIDAIEPAWNHTSRLLLAPRDWRLLLKIGAVAFFAQVAGFNSSFRLPARHMHSLSPAFVAASVALALAIGAVVFFIGLALFYLGSRLQFVLFEIVLRSDTRVAPIWRRYGRATWHWIALKIVFFFAALVCVAPIVIPLVIHFFHRVVPLFHGRSLQYPAAFFVQLFGFLGTIFVILLIIGIGYVMLLDFGVPSMALESTPMPETVRRVWSLLRHEPGPVLLYLLMRFLLGIAGSLAAYLVLLAGALAAAVPLGGAALITWLSLHHTGIAGHAVMVFAWIVLALVFAVLLVIALIMVMGCVYTFLQAYALYFLAGRYLLVGQYLAPFLPPSYGYSAAAPAYPQPAPPADPQSRPAEG